MNTGCPSWPHKNSKAAKTALLEKSNFLGSPQNVCIIREYDTVKEVNVNKPWLIAKTEDTLTVA